MQTYRVTIAREGVRGLYKGAASPLAGAMATNAAGFFSFGMSKKLATTASDIDPAHGKLSLAGLFKAGVVSGCFCLMIEHPVDLVKTQMQVQLGRDGGRYRGVFDCGRQIVHRRGLVGLYQGVGANFFRFVPGRGVYMSSFEWLERNFAAALPGPQYEVPVWFGAGACAGVAAWTSTYPADVIRNIMMSDHEDPRQRRYATSRDAVRELYRREGLAGFWRGFSACLLRAAPVNGSVFVLYKLMQRFLEQRNRE